MNNILLESLNAYCDGLLNESPVQNKRKKKKVNKIETESTIVKLAKSDSSLPETNDFSRFSDKISFTSCYVQSSSTNDKTASAIDKDNYKKDSSDCSDNENKHTTDLYLEKVTSNNPCYSVTDDGFKIMSNIPSDDSDASDAFEESDWEESGVNGREGFMSSTSSNAVGITNSSERVNPLIKRKLENMKKPLLDLIKDFDLEERLFLNNKSQLRLKRSSSNKNQPAPKNKKSLSNQDITVIDYSHQKQRKQEENDLKPGSKTKKPSKEELKNNNISKESVEMSFKRARNEIFKFGLSGFNKEDRKTAKMNMLIKLGAKPPKNKAVNYKVLMEERKLRKEMERKDREEKRRMGLPIHKEVEKKNRNKDIVSIQNAPIGKFKGGVLTLSKKDIRKINGKK